MNYTPFSKHLKEARESLGLNKREFADYVGTSAANITRYERSEIGASVTQVEKIAHKLGVNPGWFMGWTDEKYAKPKGEEKNEGKQVPIIGIIAAGTPILASENFEAYEIVPLDSDIDFCLRVKGDSMINARIYDGDIVCIKKQPDVETGEIAAVLIGGEEATLKRVYYLDGSIMLHPENPRYDDIIISKKDQKTVQILGKAVWLKGDVR